jgi:hypothetical protein
MIDTHAGSDEDYLVVGPDNSYMGAVIQATANRPAPSIAKQLLKEGALVASGILLGYAQAFAAHIYKHWPQLALQMYERPESIAAPECEHRLATNAYKQLPNSVFSSIRLSPPTFPMRAFRVYGSGWCSRRSPPTIVRIRTPVQRAITYRPDLAATDYTS